ncbi:hypothetical protein LENED_007977 [Lentinula edodes]|uniref:Uncharacterized protein n=1 Tax=Lentinula edodes TaxID=5353 RepID=A0A1Q3EFV5_LENED|nr:hypothetical protein LENED_007977 [Lentinula edodes]
MDSRFPSNRWKEIREDTYSIIVSAKDALYSSLNEETPSISSFRESSTQVHEDDFANLMSYKLPGSFDEEACSSASRASATEPCDPLCLPPICV